MTRPIVFLTLVASIFLVTACDKDDPVLDPFPDGIQSVWGEMFAPYGLYPLFPVRTDVQPGDVVVMCQKAPSLQSRLAAVAVSGAVPAQKPEPEYEWRQLFSFPGIDGAIAAQAASRMNYNSFSSPAASAPLGAASGAAPYSTGGAVTHAGFASFPTVLSYSQRRTDLGLGGSAGVVAVGAGASKSSQSTYLLEIPAAEFATVTHAQLQKVLTASIPILPPEMKLTLADVKAAYKDGTCIAGSLSVVGEAFYARRINVSVGDSFASAISARAAYQLPVDSTRAEVFKALGSYATGASAPAAAASSAFPTDAARLAKLMIDIDSAYKAADANSKLGFTGVRAGFAKAGGKGLSMDYSYALPVAFGVRLYSLEMNDDGTLSDRLSLGGSRPWTGQVKTPFEGRIEGGSPPAPRIGPPPAASAPVPK